MNKKQKAYLDSLGPIRPANENPALPGFYARAYDYAGHIEGSVWLAARDYWSGRNWYVADENGAINTLPAGSLRSWRGLYVRHEVTSEFERSLRAERKRFFSQIAVCVGVVFLMLAVMQIYSV